MRIVIKIGSNVLTREDGTLDTTRISALVDQTAKLRQAGHELVLVSSGAVACGRSVFRDAGLNSLAGSREQTDHNLDAVEQRQLFSAVGQVRLMDRYYSLYKDYGIKVGQVLTMKESFSTEKEYQNQRACMELMLSNGVIPIVNENDTVSITELMFTDNDELSGLVAEMMQASLLILLSNVDGIYDGDPASPDVRLLTKVLPGENLSGYIRSSKSSFGRGGMDSKSGIAQKLASEGVRVIIADGNRENVLVDLLQKPEAVPHTEFVPADAKPSARPQFVANRHQLFDEVRQDEGGQEVANLLRRAKSACAEIARLSDEKRREVLDAVADAILKNKNELLAANAEDLSKMDPANPLYDRLKLDGTRLEGIAADMSAVAALPSPLGRVLDERLRPNGLHLRKVSVPFGVIGMIYEARPNVTWDVFSLCFKSGNVAVLKGGKDAARSNEAAVKTIRKVLKDKGISEDAVTLLPSTHEATAELLGAVGLVDLVIPRGGRRLIDFVRANAKVPCIETGAGVVNCYFDADGDLKKGTAIVLNAKTRRVSVCNALDCLIVHSSRLADLAELCAPLADKQVRIYADEAAYAALDGRYPLLEHADDASFGTEYMDYKMAVRSVDSLDAALEHISKYGSGHSESIVTENEATAEIFRREVDAACVYVNAPTSFTDGGQFGLGAEIGISTQKLGARGPMGLEEITSYKWLVDGDGQVRP